MPLFLKLLSANRLNLLAIKILHEINGNFYAFGGVPFPMLSDAGGRVGKAYGVFDEEAGVKTRGRFIIDLEGVLQRYEVLTPLVGRNVNETFRQVQAFQLLRKTKGAEATPSGWKPGKITLKPGPDLVGKVWEVWKTETAFD